MPVLAHNPTTLPPFQIAEALGVDVPETLTGMGELGPSQLEIERARSVDVGENTRVVFRVRLTPLSETVAEGSVSFEVDRGALIGLLARAGT